MTFRSFRQQPVWCAALALLLAAWPAAPARAQAAGAGGANPEMLQYVQVFQSYLEVIARFVDMTADPTASGVAAVIYADEMLKDRGAAAGISYFTEMLGQVKNETVQRAIHFQLAELYRKNNQTDKALDELRHIMASAPQEPTTDPRYAPPPTGQQPPRRYPPER